jgi:aldehyde dehydrogenase (NAD+)
MSHLKQFYIDGRWVDPLGSATAEVINPTTEEVIAEVALGDARDADAAIMAARRAFPAFSQTSVAERVELLNAILSAFEKRADDIADAIVAEVGSPKNFARNAQAASGINQLAEHIRALENFKWETMQGTTLIVREAIGVAGLITPWNWPINQLVCKVAPAIAAGCTMVVKPSELSPLNTLIFAEAMDAAGVPAGVFNLVNGDGPTVGAAIASHPEVDIVSFTGSTRAGIEVARAAAGTVKRVAQELGGKAPTIMLPDADMEKTVAAGIQRIFANSGQSCSAPSRMLVPADRMQDAARIARQVADAAKVGDPTDPATTMGPVVSRQQYDKIQNLIASGVAEGATLVAGGTGLPEGVNRGYFIRPTIFADVTPDMRIAREEIFGPVMSIMAYETIDQAVEIANDTPYGLSAYVQGADADQARAVARRLRAGQVHVNNPPPDRSAPFGGYKQSGNGREYGEYGISEFLEMKALTGYGL